MRLSGNGNYMETTGGPKIGCPRRGFGPPSVFITGVDDQ